MEKSNFELVTENMRKQGLEFTTFSVLEQELMQNPEFRRIREERRPAFEKTCAEIDARNKRKDQMRGLRAQQA